MRLVKRRHERLERAATGPRPHRHQPAARYPDRARRPAVRSRPRGRQPGTRRRHAAAGGGRRRRSGPCPGRDAARGSRADAPPRASGRRSGAISSNVMPNTSCSTNASRSAGSRVSSTTSSASPTESASMASDSGSRVGASDDRIGHVHVQGILPARRPCSQHVQAHARDDGRQPGAQVLDGADVGPAEPNPALLDRVLCFARGPEHPIRHRPQVRPVLLRIARRATQVWASVTFLRRGPSW